MGTARAVTSKQQQWLHAPPIAIMASDVTCLHRARSRHRMFCSAVSKRRSALAEMRELARQRRFMYPPPLANMSATQASSTPGVLPRLTSRRKQPRNFPRTSLSRLLSVTRTSKTRCERSCTESMKWFGSVCVTRVYVASAQRVTHEPGFLGASHSWVGPPEGASRKMHRSQGSI